MPSDAAESNLPEDQPVIDVDHLATFTDGDMALESELGALYVSSAEIYLEQMNRALERDEPWVSSAHALKGASSNLGAPRVAALALAAERSSPSAALLKALRSAVNEVRSFFADRRS